VTSRPVVLGGPADCRLGRARWPRYGEQELDALRTALIDRDIALEGDAQADFERRFAAFQGARYGLCVANGTIGLQLVYEALDIGRGDEVIVPGLTWQATAAAVLDVNAVPILVDVDPDTYCIDARAAEAAITSRTRAIVAVHLYNSMPDFDALLELAETHGLTLIEDCAHAHGSQWRSRGAGSIGRIASWSFQHTKSLSAGEGGFITTDDAALREAIYSLRNCGRRRRGSDPALMRPIQSGNYRMPEAASALLGAQLSKLPEEIARREEAERFLDERLSSLPGIDVAQRHPGVTRQGMYGYVVRYDEAAFAGLELPDFHRALAAELEIWLKRTYEPLNDSPLYRPHTKRRHHLDPDYWEQIDPRRFSLPVAERAHRREAIIIPHEYLLESRARLEAIPRAISKIHHHAEELHEWATTQATAGAR
jgi:L-glutamine:2-deoxy-scyllo-inosose/3-amino-2,3-dideoxy-scyllo-inosose aminotransferase